MLEIVFSSLLMLVLDVGLVVSFYAVVPFVIATSRETEPITVKKYFLYCFLANIAILVFLSAITECFSIGVYLVWTFVFSQIGCAILYKRQLIIKR